MNDAEQTIYRARLTTDLGRQLDSIAGLLAATGKVAPDVSPDMRQARMDAMAQQVNTRDQLEKFNLRRRKVEAALSDPADSLIIEGWPWVDQQRGLFVVLAKGVTTKKIQRAQREKQATK